MISQYCCHVFMYNLMNRVFNFDLNERSSDRVIKYMWN